MQQWRWVIEEEKMMSNDVFPLPEINFLPFPNEFKSHCYICDLSMNWAAPGPFGEPLYSISLIHISITIQQGCHSLIAVAVPISVSLI